MDAHRKIAVAGATGRVRARRRRAARAGTRGRRDREVARHRRGDRRRARGGARRRGRRRRCGHWALARGAGGDRVLHGSGPQPAGGRRTGRRERIVVVSIIGSDRFNGGYGAAKVATSRRAVGPDSGPRPARGAVPRVRAQLVEWGRQGDVTYVPKMRMQLVAAAPSPTRRGGRRADRWPGAAGHRDRGPEEESLADAARLLIERTGEQVPDRGRQRPGAGGDLRSRRVAAGAGRHARRPDIRGVARTRVPSRTAASGLAAGVSRVRRGTARPRGGLRRSAPVPGRCGRRPGRRRAGRAGRAPSSRRAHSSGVERSWCRPAAASARGGSFAPAGPGVGASRATGGTGAPCRCRPPWRGRTGRGRPPRRRRRRGPAGVRPAGGEAESPHGKRKSAHSVLACRPWLSSPQSPSPSSLSPRRSGRARRCRRAAAACSGSARRLLLEGRVDDAQRVSRSSRSGPSCRARTTAARSATHARPQTSPSTRPVACIAVVLIASAPRAAPPSRARAGSRASGARGIALGDERAVRDAVERPASAPSAWRSRSRSATVVRAEEAALRPERRAHARDCAGRRAARSDAPIAAAAPGTRAPGTGAALVDQHEAVAVGDLAEPLAPGGRRTAPPGWPGPPVRKSSTPRGASASSRPRPAGAASPRPRRRGRAGRRASST